MDYWNYADRKMKMMRIRARHNWVAVVLLFAVSDRGEVSALQNSFPHEFPPDVQSIIENNVVVLDPIVLEWTQKRSPNVSVESFSKRFNIGQERLGLLFGPENYSLVPCVILYLG